MRPIIGAVAIGALVVGGGLVLANSRHSSGAQPYSSPAPIAEPIAPAPAAPVASFAIADTTATRPVALPVAQTTRTRRVVYRNGVAYRTAAPAHTRVVTHTRSTKHSVEIIGGSAIGGALVGGLVGGKKGAVIGGLVGGGAGTVYDRKTRHKVRRE